MTIITDQKYPPENGQGPHRFQRQFLDDITNILTPEDQLARDFNERLRDIHDFDEPDRDEILEHWTFRTEDNPPDP